MKTVRQYGEKSFNIKRMPNFPTGVNDGLQGTSNSYRATLWDTRCWELGGGGQPPADPEAPGADRCSEAVQVPVYSSLTDSQVTRVARTVRRAVDRTRGLNSGA